MQKEKEGSASISNITTPLLSDPRLAEADYGSQEDFERPVFQRKLSMPGLLAASAMSAAAKRGSDAQTQSQD